MEVASLKQNYNNMNNAIYHATRQIEGLLNRIQNKIDNKEENIYSSDIKSLEIIKGSIESFIADCKTLNIINKKQNI